MNLHLGDCLEVLKTLPENSIDACVTDPPYGWRFMGKAWDGADIIRQATRDIPKAPVLKKDGKIRQPRVDAPSEAGKYEQTCEANKKFQEWTMMWAREVFRVLKPGAHALVFCGPRTYHRMASGLEDAGFEIRDQLQWLFGSGFPKSLDISKAIDKAAGAKREVVGAKERPGGFDRGVLSNKNFGNIHTPDSGNITVPSTIAAKQWQGFGTGLKPANEPICLARKPISESTVAKNVLKWGTGGLNIDGCRIAVSNNDPNHRKPSIPFTGRYFNVADGKSNGRPTENLSSGRFPANLVFSHSEYCTDEQCDIECAIKMLDKQSGVLKSGERKSASSANENRLFKLHGHASSASIGGASRFFYCAKTSPSERNMGVDRFDCAKIDLSSCDVDTELATLLLKAILESINNLSIAEYGGHISVTCPKECLFTIRTTIRRITESKTLNWWMHSLTNDCIPDAFLKETVGINLAECARKLKELMTQTGTLPDKDGSLIIDAVPVILKKLSSLSEENVWQTMKCSHPTLKPIRLMSYLCRLVTPPAGVIIDPFMGSGSTGMAALREGFDFIGIEREKEYFEIAEKRIGLMEAERAS